MDGIADRKNGFCRCVINRWLVAKFGGTSVGKFLDNIALEVVP